MADFPATTATSKKPNVTLHWLDRSRSQRIVWLLQECGDKIDYNIKVYKRQPDMLAPPSLKEVHPLGKSPTITIATDAQPKPMVIAESGFMTEYLTEYFAPHLAPKRYQEGKENQVGGETEQWFRYRYYMHYAEGSIMTMLLLQLIMDQIKNPPGVPFFVKPVPRFIAAQVEKQFLTASLNGHFQWLNDQVASSPDGGKFLCGKDLTAADIMMSFPLIAGKSKVSKAKYPKLYEYIELLENHPGYVASIKKIEDVSGEKFVANFDR